jgi:hypothetical protein
MKLEFNLNQFNTFQDAWLNFETAVEADAIQLVRIMSRHFAIVKASGRQLFENLN